MSQQDTQLTASEKRATHPDFIKTFSLEALRDRLPFRFPVPEGLPSSPKPRYRSYYRYLSSDDPSAGSGQALVNLAVLATLTLFEIALRLVDFSPLRDVLAQFPGLSVQDRLLRPECQRSDPLRPGFPLPLCLLAAGTELRLASSS
jgi:hypothetical protein